MLSFLNLASPQPAQASARLRRLRLAFVYEQSRTGVLVNLALSGLLAILLADDTQPALLGAWLVVLNALGAVRLLLAARFRAAGEEAPTAPWRLRLRMIVAATGLAWGAGAVLLAQHAPLEHQALLVLVLAGLCAGGLVNLSPVFSCYRLYVPLMLLPISLSYAVGASAVQHTLALMALVFGAALVVAGRKYSEHFNRSAELAAALAAGEARFAGAFRNAPLGMLLVDAEGHVRESNQVADAIVQGTPRDWMGQGFWARADRDDACVLAQRYVDLVAGRAGAFCLDTRQSTVGGQPLWVRVSVSLLPAQDESDVRAIVQLQDITATRAMAEQLAHQASHDALTELINRHECEQRIAQSIKSVRVDRGAHALLFLDLDMFKVVNDSCGHAAGDALLKQTAALLAAHVRRHDSVARFGGDEFAVLLEHCTAEQALEIAHKLCHAVAARGFAWGDKHFDTGCSVGVAAIASPDTTVANVIKAADGACHAAKMLGRNRVYQFRPDDEDLNRHRREIETVAEINRALDLNRFELHAQPIQDARLHGVSAPTHLEILVRMRDDAGSMISPGLFLPAAERYGLAPKLDRWVVRATCSWFASHPDCLDLIELCSINLSGQSLTDNDFPAFVIKLFDDARLPPHKFCFEITETAAIASIAQARDFVETLRARGFRFALDDFGSGLSSFGYLKALPVDILKIDGIFIRNVAEDELDLAMVRAINEVAKIMHKTTVAEFVENAQQLEILARLGIDYVQGYHIGRPIALPELFDQLARSRYVQTRKAS